jgi:integrase
VMGLYRRKWRNRDGKSITSPSWWMNAMVDGRQVCKPTGVTNKRIAQQIYDVWRAEVAQGRFNLLRKAPRLKDWAEKYLKTVDHPNTRKRYESSKENLVSFFGDGVQLDHVSTARIEQFKQQRREAGVKGSTINMDLRFLAQILKQAERERCLARSPFDLTKFFLNESRDRRKPHILSWEEQESLLAVASPRLRVFIVVGVETGMRTGEMLHLQWKDVDFLKDAIQVGRSKTLAGTRAVPISAQCKAELLRWRNLIGPEFSEWVFPNFSNRRHPLQKGGRKAWANALKKAGLPFFPIYYLRHTFASRLTSAGVSPLTIAQMLGHSSTQIVPRYAQVLDQNRLDAMKKLEELKKSATTSQEVAEAAADKTVQGMRQ